MLTPYSTYYSKLTLTSWIKHDQLSGLPTWQPITLTSDQRMDLDRYNERNMEIHFLGTVICLNPHPYIVCQNVCWLIYQTDSSEYHGFFFSTKNSKVQGPMDLYEANGKVANTMVKSKAKHGFHKMQHCCLWCPQVDISYFLSEALLLVLCMRWIYLGCSQSHNNPISVNDNGAIGPFTVLDVMTEAIRLLVKAQYTLFSWDKYGK